MGTGRRQHHRDRRATAGRARTEHRREAVPVVWVPVVWVPVLKWTVIGLVQAFGRARHLAAGVVRTRGEPRSFSLV